MDLKGYNIKNSTVCECGYKFDIHDMNRLQRIDDDKFYGGAIRHVDEIRCPKCSKDTILFIKQEGQSYNVKDIAQKIEEIENVCPVCSKEFKNKSGLSMHMKTHDEI